MACATETLFFKKMDVNRASMEELALLPGIGMVTSAAIVNFRHDSGFIISIDEFEPLNSPFSYSKYMTIKEYLGT
jgi:DNA uptake protein ComE-like DNA-binding protein